MKDKQRSESVYLVVSPRKSWGLSVRVAMRPPSLGPQEVALRVTIAVPDALFARPQIEATITVPPDQVSRPTISAAVVDNIRAELARTLGVDLRVQVVEPQEEA